MSLMLNALKRIEAKQASLRASAASANVECHEPAAATALPEPIDVPPELTNDHLSDLSPEDTALPGPLSFDAALDDLSDLIAEARLLDQPAVSEALESHADDESEAVLASEDPDRETASDSLSAIEEVPPAADVLPETVNEPSPPLEAFATPEATYAPDEPQCETASDLLTAFDATYSTLDVAPAAIEMDDIACHLNLFDAEDELDGADSTEFIRSQNEAAVEFETASSEPTGDCPNFRLSENGTVPLNAVADESPARTDVAWDVPAVVDESSWSPQAPAVAEEFAPHDSYEAEAVDPQATDEFRDLVHSLLATSAASLEALDEVPEAADAPEADVPEAESADDSDAIAAANDAIDDASQPTAEETAFSEAETDTAEPTVIEPVGLDPYAATAWQIVRQLPQGRSQVVMVTSPVDGNGKTRTLARLLPHLARTFSGSVLVVDANSRNPDMARWLEVAATWRLTDVLAGATHWMNAVRPTELPRVSVLPGGTESSRRSNAQAVARLLRELAAHYDLVLVDASSLAHSGAAQLAAICDATYLVVRLGDGGPRIVREAVQVVEKAGGRLLGCIAIDAGA